MLKCLLGSFTWAVHGWLFPGKRKMRSAPMTHFKTAKTGLGGRYSLLFVDFFQPFHSTVFILSLQIPSTCLLSFLSRPKLLVLYLTNDFWLVRTLFLVFLSKFPRPHSETQEGGRL